MPGEHAHYETPVADLEPALERRRVLRDQLAGLSGQGSEVASIHPELQAAAELSGAVPDSGQDGESITTQADDEPQKIAQSTALVGVYSHPRIRHVLRAACQVPRSRPDRT